jgi:hypothetical protein
MLHAWRRLGALGDQQDRHTLAQALSWPSTVLIWAVTGALVLDRFGVPFTIWPCRHRCGVALGVGAQQVVKDLIGGIFIIAERQYSFGDMRRRHVAAQSASTWSCIPTSRSARARSSDRSR